MTQPYLSPYINHFTSSSDESSVISETNLFFNDLRQLYESKGRNSRQSITTNFCRNCDSRLSNQYLYNQANYVNMRSILTKELMPRIQWTVSHEKRTNNRGQVSSWGIILAQTDIEPIECKLYHAETLSNTTVDFRSSRYDQQIVENDISWTPYRVGSPIKRVDSKDDELIFAYQGEVESPDDGSFDYFQGFYWGFFF